MTLTMMGRSAALNRAAETQAGREPPAEAAADQPVQRNDRVPAAEEAKAGFIGQLLAYIPADALAAYVAITAFIIDSSSFWRLLAMVGVAIATPIWVVIAYRDAADDPAVLDRWPVFQMIVGTIAFVAWSTSVPGSWWQADVDLSAQAGGGIAVATSIALGLVIRYYEQQHRVPKVVVAG
jgi:hypothetical protein